jgi:TolB-like protein/DNA-binding winged helix-turn-helix (wHTH) protein/Tfp pilus assembly protein PilF
MDAEDRVLLRNGQAIPLAPKEFETLLALVEAGGRLVGKEALVARVWPGTFVGDGSLARNISVLRKELGEDLILTVPKVGYRLASVVTPELSPAGTDVPEGEAGKPVISPISRSSRFNKAWLALPMLAFCAIAIFFLREFSLRPKSTSTARAPVKIAILPFVNLTGSDDQEYLCDGLTEAMIAELSRLNPDRLDVIARTSAMHYRKTSKTIPQIGRELNVDYLLESSVRASGERLHITTQLVRASDATHLWTGEYDRELKDVVQLQQQIAVAVAEEIQLKLSPEAVAALKQVQLVDPEAYRNYLLGRYYLNKRNSEGISRAHGYFQRALEIAPNYASAHAGAADAYLQQAIWGILPYLEGYAKSEAAVRKAIELDSSLPEAYTTLALLDYMYRWEWTQAEQDFRRSLQLDPNSAAGHARYADYLIAVQRPDDAIREMRRALELDPLSITVSQNAGYTYALAGRYDEALAQLRQALDLDPNNQVTHGYLGATLEWKGDYSRALEEFKTAQRVSGRWESYVSGIAHVLALMNRKKEARRILDRLLVLRDHENVSAGSLAYLYAALGDKDKAFYWLDESITEHSVTALEFNNDHSLDPLRSDPRFADLRRRFKFDASN